MASPPNTGGLGFLWLELTNRCNLQCVHCYTESNPHSGDRDLLTTADYESIMRQAHALGCRKIQFIGGEPQLNRDFLPLLREAKSIGFEFIEVFSNLTRLDDATLQFAANAGVRFATSVYSDDPDAHAAVTRVRSSHSRTIRNLKRLIDAGIETRAATIVIDQDADAVERTKAYLRRLGVRHVRSSDVREFGRGEELLDQPAQLSGLCGHCWDRKLCVAPDGRAYPCVMAREWPVGNVLEASLGEIVGGGRLAEMRRTIFESVWLPKITPQAADDCDDEGVEPGTYPGKGEPTPAECPQTCDPDFIGPACGPAHCPQSCEPFIVVCEPTGEPTDDPEPLPGPITE